MIRGEIKTIIEKSIKSLQEKKNLSKFKIPQIEIEYPREKSHGDYATNIALSIGKFLKKNPMDIANILNSEIKIKSTGLFKKIEIVEPGFINFFLSEEYLQGKVKEILEKRENYGKLNLAKGKKAQVEFISANPTGPLHIGNGRGAFFGDTLAEILEWAGYKVNREYYINDAKTNTQIRVLGKTALGKDITYKTPDLELKIKKLSAKLKTISDEGEAGHLLAQEVIRDIKIFIEKKLKIQFDSWVSEETLYKQNKVKKIYKFLKDKKLIYKKEGAEWLKTSKFGDEKDRVLVREDGAPTYLLPDIAYHKDKFDRDFKKVINIWGADHQGHVSKMKAVAKILDFKGNLDILIAQLVRLKTGKISKRKGHIISLEQLVDDVGPDATRFFYLMKSLNTQMEFNVELAKEKSQKSPVFYVQYAHARICSILRKSKNSELKKENLKLLKNPSELELIKRLIKLPEIVEDTARDYQVQRLPQYATELATTFHLFYRDCKVLTENKNLKGARLALILATKNVLHNSLKLIGVSAPEKM